jgi:hypothetical protein
MSVRLSNRVLQSMSIGAAEIRPHGQHTLCEYEADQSPPNLRSVDADDPPGRLPTPLEALLAVQRVGYHVPRRPKRERIDDVQ